MLRSLAVLVFIGGVGASAVYVGQKRTIARGDVIAADLLAANPKKLSAVTCDPEVEIGAQGAKFTCKVTFLTGLVERLPFTMNRAGAIAQGAETTSNAGDSSDPWSH